MSEVLRWGGPYGTFPVRRTRDFFQKSLKPAPNKGLHVIAALNILIWLSFLNFGPHNLQKHAKNTCNDCSTCNYRGTYCRGGSTKKMKDFFIHPSNALTGFVLNGLQPSMLPPQNGLKNSHDNVFFHDGFCLSLKSWLPCFAVQSISLWLDCFRVPFPIFW